MENRSLFKEIRNIINDRVDLNCQDNPRNFAEKYCQQQMVRKKLTPFDPKSKMNHTMKKFRNLETYVNLEQLVSIIRQKQELNRKVTDPPLVVKKKKENFFDIMKKKIAKVPFNHATTETVDEQRVINFLEKETSLQREALKNNSAHDYNRLINKAELLPQKEKQEDVTVVSLLSRIFDQSKEN